MAWHHDGNDAENLRKAIAEMSLEPADREAGYEEQIYRHLNNKYRKEKFYRQYARANSTADIFVECVDGAKVAIEVKKDLVTRAEYQRLVGQVYSYVTEWKCEVVLVICGESDPLLVRLTEDAMKFMNDKQDDFRVRFVEHRIESAVESTEAA